VLCASVFPDSCQIFTRSVVITPVFAAELRRARTSRLLLSYTKSNWATVLVPFLGIARSLLSGLPASFRPRGVYCSVSI
jgi:hypothetical protein